MRGGRFRTAVRGQDPEDPADPEDPEALVKYFFDTEINEMEYEIVRCRPLLVESFVFSRFL